MKMTIRGAAKKFAVPYSTLKDRVHGRVRHGTKPGVKTALSPEEEEELVRYVKVSHITYWGISPVINEVTENVNSGNQPRLRYL